MLKRGIGCPAPNPTSRCIPARARLSRSPCVISRTQSRGRHKFRVVNWKPAGQSNGFRIPLPMKPAIAPECRGSRRCVRASLLTIHIQKDRSSRDVLEALLRICHQDSECVPRSAALAAVWFKKQALQRIGARTTQERQGCEARSGSGDGLAFPIFGLTLAGAQPWRDIYGTPEPETSLS